MVWQYFVPDLVFEVYIPPTPGTFASVLLVVDETIIRVHVK